MKPRVGLGLAISVPGNQPAACRHLGAAAEGVFSAAGIPLPRTQSLAGRSSLASLAFAAVVAVLAAAALLLAPGKAEAANGYSDATTGSWTTTTDWTINAVPTTADNLAIGSTGSGAANPSLMELTGAVGNVNNLFIGGGDVGSGNTSGTGILDLTTAASLYVGGRLQLGGSGSGGTNNGMLNLTTGSRALVLDRLYAARASTNGVATISLDASTLSVQGSGDFTALAYDTAASGQRVTLSLANGSVVNLGATGGNATGGNTSGQVVYIGADNNDSYATISLDATSRINQGFGGRLFLRGGNPADSTTINGTTGFARYTLPLSNTSANGSWQSSGSLHVANWTNNKVQLTLDSTLAAGQRAATTLNQFGTLFVGASEGDSGTSTTNGALVMNAVNASFYGGEMRVAGHGSSWTSTGSLSLTDSSIANTRGNMWLGRGAATTNAALTLVNSRVSTRDSIIVGRESSNTGTATFSLDGTSQVNSANGGLYLRGGNNGANMAYTMPLASTAGNGRISFDRGLYVADTSSNNITLNVSSATSAATITQLGPLQIARGTNAAGTLNVSDVTLEFASNTLSIANQQDQNNQQGTLALTNSTLRNLGGSIELGKGRTTTLGTITLVNSTLETRDSLLIGRDSETAGTASISIDSTSRFNLRNGGLQLRGGSNGGNASYTLPVAAAPANGKLFFDRGIYVAESPANNVTLNLSSATSDATLTQFGPLHIARGQNATGTLNVSGMTLNFMANTLQVANQQDQNNQQGTLALTNSTLRNYGSFELGKGATTTLGTVTLVNSTLEIRDTLNIGRDSANTGRATISIDGTSRLNVLNGALALRGGNNGANAPYTLPVAAAPANGKLFFDRGILVADTPNNNVTLNLSSATSDAALTQWGGVNVARGSNATGTLALTGMTIDALGSLSLANQADQNNQQGTLTLDSSTLRLMAGGAELGKGATTTLATVTLSNAARLTVRDNIDIGRNDANTGRVALTINDTSRMEALNGSLNLRGGNSGANVSYTLPIVTQSAAGKLSFDRGLTVADTQNNNVTLTIDAAQGAAATQTRFGNLYVTNDTNGTGRLNLAGVAAEFRGGGIYLGNRTDRGNMAGTLDLTNSSLYAPDTMYLGRGTTTTNATLTLTNSTLTTRDGFQIGMENTAAGRATITLDATSRLNLLRGTITVQGGNNGANQAYSMALGDAFSPSNGRISFQGNLNVVTGNTSLATLNVTSGSAARILPRGGMNVSSGGSGQATVNVDTTAMEFGQGGTFGANAANSRAFVTLANGAGLRFGGDLTMRNAANTGSVGTVTMSSGTTSVFDGGNSFAFNGRVVVNTGGTLNVDYGNLSTSVSTTTNVIQGDTTLAGWIVNADTGGQVVLRNIRGVTSATDTTWGQATTGTAPTLVNAMRVQFGASSVTTSGDLGIGLLDRNAFGEATGRVAAYDLQSANGLVLANGPTVTVRYDSSLGATEASLKLWQLVGGTWVDKTGSVDTTNKRITSTALDAALGNLVIAQTAPANTSAVSITPFTGNRAQATTVFTAASGNWTASSWSNLVPERRDIVRIADSSTAGGAGTAAVTLDNGALTTVRQLQMAHAASNSGTLNVANAGTILRATTNNLDAATNASGASATLNVTAGGVIRVDQSLNLATNSTTTGTITVDGAGSSLEVGNRFEVSRGQNSLSTITLSNGGRLDVRENAIFGADNGSSNGKVTLSIDATSRMDVLYDLYLRGRESNSTAVTYTLPLAGITNAGAGRLSVGRSLYAADIDNQRITLNIDSTLAAGQAAATAVALDGQFTLATGTNTVGTANVTGVALSTASGDFNLATGSGGVGTLNLTDSSLLTMGNVNLGTGNNNATAATMTLVNSRFETRGSVTVGIDGNANGTPLALSLDGTSRFDVLFDLALRGGNQGGTATYTLPIVDRQSAADGKLSVGRGITVANTNNNRVTLNIDATSGGAGSTIDLAGGLSVGTGNTANGRVNLVGTALGVAGDFNLATNDNAKGTLTLDNASLLVIGNTNVATGTNNTVEGNITLANSSRLDIRGGLTAGVGSGNGGPMNLSIDNSSQMNVLSGLTLRGGFNNANYTYTLPLTDTKGAGNGKLSVGGALAVADGNNNRVTLVLDSTLGSNAAASQIDLNGGLSVGTGNTGYGVVTMNQVALGLAGDVNLGTNDNSRGTLTLTDSSIMATGNMNVARGANATVEGNISLTRSTLDMRGSLTVGRDNGGGPGGPMALTLDGTSRFNVLGSLTLRHSGAANTNYTYTLPLASWPADGKMAVTGAITVADSDNARTTLTLDSTLPAGQAAAERMVFNGGLSVGTGNGSRGGLNLNGVDASFMGDMNMATNVGTNVGTLSLTNSRLVLTGNTNWSIGNSTTNTSSVTLVNSRYETRGGLRIGADTANGNTTLSLDATSRIDVATGDLDIRGGNNAGSGVVSYTLPLAGASASGKLSVNGNVYFARTASNRMAITVDSTLAAGQAAATDMTFGGGFFIAGGGTSTGNMTVRATTMRFNGSGEIARGGTSQSRITLDSGNLAFNGGLTIRNATTDSAEIIGKGRIDVAGQLSNSGRIVADGGPLVLTANSITRNTGIAIAQATGSFGQAGWFAFNQGVLTLPDTFVSGTSNAVWGGAYNDANPTLVNSMKFTAFTNLQPGILSGSVIDPELYSLSTEPLDKVSAWNFSGLEFDAATMVVRYDDVRATALGIDQAALKLWHYTGGNWADITGSVDTTNKRITSTSINDLSPFVVSVTIPVPEPGSLAVVAAALAGLAGWRMRRRRPGVGQAFTAG